MWLHGRDLDEHLATPAATASTAGTTPARTRSMGLLRDAKAHGSDRLEAACRRALQVEAPSRKSVKAILARGLDRLPLDGEVHPASGGAALIQRSALRTRAA